MAVPVWRRGVAVGVVAVGGGDGSGGAGEQPGGADLVVHEVGGGAGGADLLDGQAAGAVEVAGGAVGEQERDAGVSCPRRRWRWWCRWSWRCRERGAGRGGSTRPARASGEADQLLGLGNELAKLEGLEAGTCDDQLTDTAKRHGLSYAITHTRLAVACAKARLHRREHADHYQSCGKCRNCKGVRGPDGCQHKSHRDDVGAATIWARG